MEYKDYYEVMGLKRDATQDEIKRSYRKLARKYHPDVSKDANAEEKFKLVGEAYEVLKDPEKRAAYDQLGANWKNGQEFTPPPGYGGFDFTGGGYTQGDASQFSDFFESIFGHGFQGGGGHGQARGQRSYHARGEDLNARVSIDLEDSFNGATRSIKLSVPELDAQGRMVQKQRTLNIKIPKGIRSGQKIRLAGQGGPGQGEGGKGDLYLEVTIKPHHIYRVDGKDLYLDLPITPWEAALGAKVKVPTPAGTVDMNIPAGSASGKKLRLKGRGIPAKKPGDLYVVLQIVVPPARDEKTRKIYEEMKKELDFNPRARLGV